MWSSAQAFATVRRFYIARKMKVKKIVMEAPNVVAQSGPRKPRSATPAVSEQCRKCRFWAEGTTTCRAYPDGIPRAILTGSYDHTKPYSGDRGFRFQPLPE